MRAHGDHRAVHVHHRVTLCRPGTGLFDMARAAASVLLAERPTFRALAFHDVTLVIDRTAVFAAAGMRRCLAFRDGHVGTLAVVAGGDAAFTLLQTRLVRRLRLRPGSRLRPHDEPEQRRRQNEPRHDSTSLTLLTSRTIGRSSRATEGSRRAPHRVSLVWQGNSS